MSKRLFFLQTTVLVENHQKNHFMLEPQDSKLGKTHGSFN